ncbi:MAG: sensor histidine kinase [Solirubrobacteraceae bacterium]
MSLHRRITAAATIAVAAVCLVFAPVSYLTTRARLTGQIKSELARLAQPVIEPSGLPVRGERSGAPDAQRGAGGRPSLGDDDAGVDTCAFAKMTAEERIETALGGPTGYFQSVCANGSVVAQSGGRPQLPVTAQVRAVARTLHGAYYFSGRVRGTRLEIYVVPDPADRKAVEVAVPLTSTDAALRGLAFTDVLLAGGGILLAGLIGALVARSALAPIRRFTDETERVTSALEQPLRLDEEGALEIRRLAASFNQTLEALEQSVQAQRHLIADASHELRTPIAALRSNVQIFLESERLPAEEQAGLRDAILAELDELTQLVADVLELARGARQDEHVEEVELDAIVQDAVERGMRRSPDLRFTVELEPTTIANSADRVARAVGNVVDNARRWSKADGEVQVRLHAGALSVRDHGPGFRDEDLQHVFERFYRSAEARRMPGSGLGLAIVKQAAEAHGGFVSAGNAPDGGAIVQLSFGPPV